MHERLKAFRFQGAGLGRFNIGVLMITYTILGGPDYNYSRMGPKTLIQLLRPLY